MPGNFTVSSAAAHVAGLARHAVDILLPPQCPACSALVYPHDMLCAACFGAMGFVTEPLCACCGVMFAYAEQGGQDRLCPTCRAAPPTFARARAAFRYDANARRIILPFKYSDRVESARVLSRHMVRAGGALLREADVLVPVPLHRRRLFARRYNQAALLARAIARTSGVPVSSDSLVRHRSTAPMGAKTAAERHAELDAAFDIRPSRRDAVAGRRVLLIDDVMTSGATANACATALKAAGAAEVAVLVAARVPDPRLTT